MAIGTGDDGLGPEWAFGFGSEYGYAEVERLILQNEGVTMVYPLFCGEFWGERFRVINIPEITGFMGLVDN